MNFIRAPKEHLSMVTDIPELFNNYNLFASVPDIICCMLFVRLQQFKKSDV
jgi:hypothetical protein